MSVRPIFIFGMTAFISLFALNAHNCMSQSKSKTLAQGKWGGPDVSMTVGESSAELQFACGDGEITGSIELDKNNRFKTDGTYSRRGPGPIREGDHGRPAEYIGHLSGDRLTLKIILKIDNSEIGEYVLDKGKSVRIHRCY